MQHGEPEPEPEPFRSRSSSQSSNASLPPAYRSRANSESRPSISGSVFMTGSSSKPPPYFFRRRSSNSIGSYAASIASSPNDIEAAVSTETEASRAEAGPTVVSVLVHDESGAVTIPRTDSLLNIGDTYSKLSLRRISETSNEYEMAAREALQAEIEVTQELASCQTDEVITSSLSEESPETEAIVEISRNTQSSDTSEVSSVDESLERCNSSETRNSNKSESQSLDANAGSLEILSESRSTSATSVISGDELTNAESTGACNKSMGSQIKEKAHTSNAQLMKPTFEVKGVEIPEDDPTDMTQEDLSGFVSRSSPTAIALSQARRSITEDNLKGIHVHQNRKDHNIERSVSLEQEIFVRNHSRSEHPLQLSTKNSSSSLASQHGTIEAASTRERKRNLSADQCEIFRSSHDRSKSNTSNLGQNVGDVAKQRPRSFGASDRKSHDPLIRQSVSRNLYVFPIEDNFEPHDPHVSNIKLQKRTRKYSADNEREFAIYHPDLLKQTQGYRRSSATIECGYEPVNESDRTLRPGSTVHGTLSVHRGQPRSEAWTSESNNRATGLTSKDGHRINNSNGKDREDERTRRIKMENDRVTDGNSTRPLLLERSDVNRRDARIKLPIRNTPSFDIEQPQIPDRKANRDHMDARRRSLNLSTAIPLSNAPNQTEISTIFHQPITRDSLGTFRERSLDISLVIHPLTNGKNSSINPVIYSIKSQADNSSFDSICPGGTNGQQRKSDSVKSRHLPKSSSCSEILGSSSELDSKGDQNQLSGRSYRSLQHLENEPSARHSMNPRMFNVYNDYDDFRPRET